MARDGIHWVARTTLHAAGTKGGTVSNDFAFLWNGTGTPTVTDLANVHTAVTGFYQTVNTPNPPINHWLGGQFDRSTNQCEVATYSIDMADPHHYYGSPVHVTNFTLGGTAGSNPLPNEMAVVLSIRGDYGTDPEHLGRTRPRASDRGRIYLGPLDQIASINATTSGSQVYAVIDPALLSALGTAVTRLKTSLVPQNWALAVWSRLEQLYKIVMDYAVNNTWDVMHKRAVGTPINTWISV